MAAPRIDLDRGGKTPLARTDLRVDPECHRDRAARLGRQAALLARPGGSAWRLPRHRTRGLRTSDQRAIRDWHGVGRHSRRRAPAPFLNTRLVAGSAAPAGALYNFGTVPLPFQMGVPSQDAFPFKLWSRILAREARRAATAPVAYPDPRGEPDLRKEITAYLAIARRIRCTPSQVLVTTGFSSALGLAVRGLELEGRAAWMEDPGFPLTRTALGLAGMTVTAVPVDAEGLDIAAGLRSAAGAALAVVTPGQQAPLGMTMSLPRRLSLLAWARRNGAWVIEDDYLSELQLKGRAAPALASLDHGGRVLHIGSFSKTISPALRLGFLVIPPELARRFGELAACLAPAPAAPVQCAVAAFLREGHYLRHLRRMKRLYASRRGSLLRCLGEVASGSMTVKATAGLNVVVLMPKVASDVDIASRALPFGLAPSPLFALVHAVSAAGTVAWRDQPR